MALQQDIVNRIINVSWPTGAWVAVEVTMISSQGGGDADFTFDLKLSANSSAREFSVKDSRFVTKRLNETGNISVPAPGPPEKWQKEILLKATAFNYDDLIMTRQIVPGAGGVDHRNLGLYHNNVFMFDVAALRRAANLDTDADLQIKFEPSMNFTVNTIGEVSSVPVEWVIPVHVFRWTGIENGIAWDVYDHTDNNYLVFDTYQQAIDFRDYIFSGEATSDNPLSNYPGVGPVGSQWSRAVISESFDANVYQRGGTSDTTEYFGDIYSINVKVTTYKTLKEYYLEQFTDAGSGFDVYEDLQFHGKKTDDYEYRVSIYVDGYSNNITRQLTKNNTFYSAVDMELPEEIVVKIDRDLKITGPESPPDDPDGDDEG